MVVFNGAHMSAISDKLHVADVIVYPPDIKETTVSPALKDGDIFSGKTFGTRQVDVIFAVMENDTAKRSRIIQAVNQWSYSRVEKELRVPQEPNGYLMAVCTSLPQDSAEGFDELMLVSFTCHDPYYYDFSEKTAFPPGASLDAVDRDEAPPWQMVVDTHGAPDPLMIVKNDKHLIFSGLPGGKLLIDSKSQSITLDGKSAMQYLQLGSRFFDLGRGSISVETNWPCGLSWRERWL